MLSVSHMLTELFGYSTMCRKAKLTLQPETIYGDSVFHSLLHFVPNYINLISILKILYTITSLWQDENIIFFILYQNKEITFIQAYVSTNNLVSLVYIVLSTKVLGDYKSEIWGKNTNKLVQNVMKQSFVKSQTFLTFIFKSAMLVIFVACKSEISASLVCRPVSFPLLFKRQI